MSVAMFVEVAHWRVSKSGVLGTSQASFIIKRISKTERTHSQAAVTAGDRSGGGARTRTADGDFADLSLSRLGTPPRTWDDGAPSSVRVPTRAHF